MSIGSYRNITEASLTCFYRLQDRARRGRAEELGVVRATVKNHSVGGAYMDERFRLRCVANVTLFSVMA